LLHIGPPKTGSTAIQQAMHTSRAVLAEHGVLYPGTRARSRAASWAVTGSKPAVGRPAPNMTSWHRLVAEIQGTGLQRICLSHENFARADDAAIDRILNDLGRDRIHVLFVARRLDKLLPSHWQEQVKAWDTTAYESFLHRMLDGQPDAGTSGTIWVSHDIAEVMGRWAGHLGYDRMSMIVADEQDRTLVPRTFEAMLRLPGGVLVARTPRSNTSLSLPEIEALRALNHTARSDDWTPRQYWQIVQNGIVPALAKRSNRGPRLDGLPAWAFEPVADMADRQITQIEELRRTGIRVVGDPEGLRIGDCVEPSWLPPAIDSVPLDLVTAMVQGTVQGAKKMHAQDLRAAEHKTATAYGGRKRLWLLGQRTAVRLGMRRS
jgi:hypothetical protein